MASVQAGQAQAEADSGVVGGSRADRWLPGWLVFAAPAVAELAVGGYRIGVPSLWRDEAATISGSQRSFGEILTLAKNQDAVHGLYYLLMHIVIAMGGTSPTVLRLPSLVAMCVTAGLVGVLGARLARASAVPWPGAVGVLAGLLLVAVPLTTRYAQEARPYALTSLFAVLATWLLVRAADGARWPWWAAYGAAIVVTGMFNLFAVLLAVAHGVSLLAARRPLRPWLTACVAAAVLLAPVAVFSARQSSQLSWVTRPDLSTVATLTRDFAGALLLVPVVGALALLGCAAGRGIRRAGVGEHCGLTLAVVAVPWLVLPPVVLLAASLAHPVYVERYVVFCLPALSLLTAAGLAWLCVLTGQALGRRGRSGRSSRWLAVAPSALVGLVMVAGLAGPQVAIRQVTSRPDDLRAVAAVLAAHEKPGDAIEYLPWNAELAGLAYPVPFVRLRDVGLGETPVASATLRGLPAGASVVAARLAGVPRLWTVQWATPLPGQGVPAADAPITRAIGAMHLLRRWKIGSVLLSLYAR